MCQILRGRQLLCEWPSCEPLCQLRVMLMGEMRPAVLVRPHDSQPPGEMLSRLELVTSRSTAAPLPVHPCACSLQAHQ